MFPLNEKDLLTPSYRNSDVPPCDGVARFFSSSDGADFDGGGSTSCTQSHVFTATDSHIQTELSQLDWNFGLDDIWNHQGVE